MRVGRLIECFFCVCVCSQNKGMGGTDAKRADHVNRHSQRYGTPNTGKHDFLSLSLSHTLTITVALTDCEYPLFAHFIPTK